MIYLSIGCPMPGERFSLDGEWLFRLDPDDEGRAARWFHPDTISAPWRRFCVPGFWDQNGADGAEGIGWYRHEFVWPHSETNASGRVCLAGISADAEVWINGVALESVSPYPQRFAAPLPEKCRRANGVIVIRTPDQGAPGGMLQSAWIGHDDGTDSVLRGPHSAARAGNCENGVRAAVIYEAYPRSFSREGTFEALTRRLSELVELGVTVLWMTPIHPIGVERRKGSLGCPYAVQDYYAINPEYGTLKNFKTLVGAAHDHGLKLIIDLVANHTAWDSPLLRDHPDWYVRDKRGEIVPPLDDWTDVAQLDHARPELRRYLIDMMLYWVRDVGVDGFRCDVAGMVPHDFWVEARRELDAVRPIMMLAEDDQPIQHVDAFDLTYDWRTYQALGRLRAGLMRPQSIEHILANERLDFPAGGLQMRFSSNHDLCAWHTPAIERYGPDAARAAAAITFAIPGVPLIYNGQEAANCRPLSLFDRTPINWDTPDLGMRETYAGLARLRRDNASLRGRDVSLASLTEREDVLAVVRAGGGKTTCALINCSDDRRVVELGSPLPNRATTLLGTDRLSPGDECSRVDLSPFGFWFGA